MSQKSDVQPNNTAFGRGSYRESVRIADILRTESVGGSILLIATVLAIIFANTPLAAAYFGVRDAQIGPEIPGFHHLHMSVGTWAADGLLVVFFFLTGLELKKEFVIGDLKSPGTAIIPIAAACGGVITPAILYFIVNHASETAVHGWAIPTATDIAFAVAVLAGVGTHLPSAMRIFLLTLSLIHI